MEFTGTRSLCGLGGVKEEGLPAAGTSQSLKAEFLGFGLREQVEGTLLAFTQLLKLKSNLAQPEMWRDLDKESEPYLDGSVFSA